MRPVTGGESPRPKTTPGRIVDRLNEEINASFADAKIKARLADLGGPPLAGSPTDFRKLIGDETEKWGKVIPLCQHQAGVSEAHVQAAEIP